MLGVHLEIRHNQVQVVVRLGARRQRIRRDAAHGRHDHVDAVAEQARSRLERQRHAFDDDVRPVVVPEVAVDLLHAARDTLRHPIVVVGTKQVHVALNHLPADVDHLGRRKTRVDTQDLERAIEPLDMLLELEDPAFEGAGDIERAVAEDPAPVPERHEDLALGHELSVEIGDPLVRQIIHGGDPLQAVACGRAYADVMLSPSPENSRGAGAR